MKARKGRHPFQTIETNRRDGITTTAETRTRGDFRHGLSAYHPSLITDHASQSTLYNGQVGSHLDPLEVFCVLYVGGNSNTNASNSVQYGLSYANANNDLSNANTNIGSRLSFENERITVTPTLPRILGRTSESIQTSPVAHIVTGWKIDKGRFDDMRQRLSGCYREVCSMEVLDTASEDACEPRKERKEVAIFHQDKEGMLKQLQYELSHHLYVPGEYNIYYKMERGKKRLIADLPLRDRIVHCAIAIVIEDRLNRTLIWQTHASIKGHGTHTVMMDIRRHLYNDPKLCYGLSMDIDQCYASMPPLRIKMMLREYIKDTELLTLLDLIIDSYNATGHPGIALGGRLSPLFANLYLSPLDHYMKEELHVHVMERYMDNFFVFGYSKPWLHHIHAEVSAYLGEMGLTLNSNVIIQPIDSTHGMDVVGWVIYSDHVLIRKRTKENMRRTFKRIADKLDACQELDEHDKGAMGSYVGSLKWFDSRNLC